MPDREPPDLKLASSQSEAERKRIERERLAESALQTLRWSLRELSANLIRVVRGAGAAYKLGPQIAAVVSGFEEYREATGLYPSDYDLSEMLSIDRDFDRFRHLDDEFINMKHAEETMVRGALQLAASELLGQSTQMAAGRSELLDGHREWERSREAYARKARTRPPVDFEALRAKSRRGKGEKK